MKMMNLSTSDSESSRSFDLLDQRIQRWIWDHRWSELRDIQEYSIPVILEAQKDVVLAAATASGKTEAAFLPILTRLLQDLDIGCVLYISPLKALINDQFERLESLCEQLEIPITPWHGDAVQTKKKKYLDNPRGVLLITPESLEALFMLRGHTIPHIFKHLRYMVVDELHVFIGTERGKQLQSLMHRIDIAIKRITPRIALSATLGDMFRASQFLRPNAKLSVEIIESKADLLDLKLLLKGYIKQGEKDEEGQEEKEEYLVPIDMVDDLFKRMRGTSNLIFPNSRNWVEMLSDTLRQKSENMHVENEFFPHHGNLSKSLREEVEAILKRGKPMTVICTTTLELGIDIGHIQKVAQISPAPSVASLRQRLGRSGRRKGEAAILYAYVIEDAINVESRISTRLRIGLVQLIAQIHLLIKKWYEPPQIKNLHASTFVQQLLSLIAQYDGIRVADAWKILQGGAFSHFSKQDFIGLLRHLGERDIIMQMNNGLLLHGVQGEKIVNNYKFYAAFKEQEEYRIVYDHKTLGSIPIDYDLDVDSCIVFAGKRWRVIQVESDRDKIKRIDVVPDYSGTAPIFSSENMLIDDRVYQEMYRILVETDQVPFLDQTASDLLAQARSEFQLMKLGDKPQTILVNGLRVLIFTWRGSRVTETICLLLEKYSVKTIRNFGIIGAETSLANLLHVFKKIIDSPMMDSMDLISTIDHNKILEKWNHLLPEPLLSKNYASVRLDLKGAMETIQMLIKLYPAKITESD